MAAVDSEKDQHVQTVEDILRSTGNDELRFGLLISLIKVNQASNKDVVDTVLHLVNIPQLNSPITRLPSYVCCCAFNCVYL